MRVALVSLVAALACSAALAPAGGATNECRGIQACIRVVGPWVIVPARGSTSYLLSCPGGRSVVGGGSLLFIYAIFAMTLYMVPPGSQGAV